MKAFWIAAIAFVLLVGFNDVVKNLERIAVALEAFQGGCQ